MLWHYISIHLVICKDICQGPNEIVGKGQPFAIFSVGSWWKCITAHLPDCKEWRETAAQGLHCRFWGEIESKTLICSVKLGISCLVSSNLYSCLLVPRGGLFVFSVLPRRQQHPTHIPHFTSVSAAPVGSSDPVHVPLPTVPACTSSYKFQVF